MKNYYIVYFWSLLLLIGCTEEENNWKFVKTDFPAEAQLKKVNHTGFKDYQNLMGYSVYQYQDNLISGIYHLNLDEDTSGFETYVYNQEKLLIQKSSILKKFDGSLEIISRTNFIYQEGQLKEEIIDNIQGIDFKIEYAYEDGRLKIKSHFSGNGELQYRETYIYNGQGQISEIQSNGPSGDLRYIAKHLYENDLLKQIVNVQANGEAIRKTVFTYDQNGNLITKDVEMLALWISQSSFSEKYDY
jgi:hypothetical protein